MPELAAMSAGERRWEGLVRDSTETKLAMQYSTEHGIFYEPSGGLQTAARQLHVPWPLPARRIPFPRSITASADRAAAIADSSSSEEDEPPTEDAVEEHQEEHRDAPQLQPARVTRSRAAAS